jgi:hypothetical protein
VAAGSSEPIECSLDFYRPGAFTNQVHVYVDVRGELREFVLTVYGTVNEGGK